MVQTTNKALVSDQGLRREAGDGNRTRALSLGITASSGLGAALARGNECQGEPLSSIWYPLLTVAYRTFGHGSGTVLSTAPEGAWVHPCQRR